MTLRMACDLAEAGFPAEAQLLSATCEKGQELVEFHPDLIGFCVIGP